MPIYLNSNNRTKIVNIFEGRKNYKEQVLYVKPGFIPETLSTPLLETEIIKDFYLDNKVFQGRLDTNSDSIIPNRSKIRSIRGVDPTISQGSNVESLNFVASAFENLSKQISEKLRAGQFVIRNNTYLTSSPIINLKAVKGYTDPRFLFAENLNLYREFLRSFVKNPLVMKKVFNFSTFCDFVQDSLEAFILSAPMFFSDFIKSRQNSILNSGLAVEYASLPYDDDSRKISNFYQDPNFEFFTRLAGFNGFSIDKHTPFRLVANITTPQMKYYILQNSVNLASKNVNSMTPQNIIEDFYLAANSDFNDFYVLLTQVYNEFVQQSPNIRVPILAKCGVMADSLKTRKLILDNNSNINLSDEEFKKMIVTYIKVKNTKSTITYKKETLNIIIQDALKFNKSYGLGKCIQYVDKKFNGFENQEGSEFYNVTKKNNEDSNSISVKTIVDNKFIQNKMKFK